jgi:hypothetical protein
MLDICVGLVEAGRMRSAKISLSFTSAGKVVSMFVTGKTLTSLKEIA